LYCTDAFSTSGQFLAVLNTLSSIYIKPVSNGGTTTAIALYIEGVFKGNSTLTVARNRWHFYAIRYVGASDPMKATVYVDGVEFIAEATDPTSAPWTDVSTMKLQVGAPTSGTNVFTYVADLVTYENYADTGAPEVWCSTMEPTGDDSETGTWAPSAGSTNFGVTTPWDTATYTENLAPASGTDKVVMTCPNIATHLGITPTVYGLVSQALVSGGSDFQALFNDGSTTTTGATVTSSVNVSTYGYATKSGGVTAGTTVKIGTKIP
jgi:hypothetical protein